MSFPAYSDYQDSGVDWIGTIPITWQLKALKHLLQGDNAGEVIDRTYWGGDLELLYTCALDPLACDFPEFPDWKRTRSSDLLLTRNGTPYVHKPVEDSIYTNVVQRITLKPNLNRDFLAIALQNAANNLRGYGVSIESLNFEMWKLLQCPLPSGSEQAAIAAFLDHETAKIDALVAEQERLIALLKEKRQAVISHAVTKGLDPNAPMKDSGVEWLGQVPAHWDIFKFSRQVHIAEGQVDPEIEPFASMVLIAPNHIESGTGRLTAVETASEQGAISGKYLCGSEDVIYSKIRPGLCKATLAPYPCLCSADMYPMRATDKVRQEFLLLILISAQFTAWSVLEADRVAMPKINREALNDLRIVVPPLQEQQCIVLEVASETDRIDDLVGAATRAIFLLRERRAALISAAVTGKIDVRGFVHPEQPAA